MSKQKALFIQGPLDDLSDLLRIARVQGKIVLRVQKVKVKPQVYLYNNGYLVVVEPDGSEGCSKDLAVEEKKNTQE